MDSGISFFVEDIEFELGEPDLVRQWVEMTADKYGHTIRQLDFIFCSDLYLLKLNKDYLDHDDYTDILTFPYHDSGAKELIGDIYISVERVGENAVNLKESFVDELHRVMIHGVLHMVGFDDKTMDLKLEMRKAENVALSLRMF